MPTRAASSRVVPVPETAVDGDTPSKLEFQESLSWRAGKPISTGELLRRLEALGSELKNIDQDDDEFDKTSLVTPAGELAQTNLLGHRDKGVRALTACCLVDVFRICAPDAPFDTQQMQGIFDLFVSNIIPLLSDPTDPYYGRYLHVVHSLSEYKTIILLADLPRPDRLVLKLFHSCFDILANPPEGLNKNMEYRLGGLLQNMVDECENLPTEVVDTILSQFLRAASYGSANSAGKAKKSGEDDPDNSRQSQLQFKQLPPAYHAAKNICNSCLDRMSRLVSQYFSNVILDASGTREKLSSKQRSRRKSKSSVDVEVSDNEDQEKTNEEDLKELEKAHQLLREIWRSSPHVLQNVIPQVDSELSAENTQIRRTATEAVGDMIAGIGAAGPPPPPVLDPAAYPPPTSDDSPGGINDTNEALTRSASLSLSQSHSTTYQSFMGRRNDKSPEIRAVWAEKIGHILSTSAGGLGMSQQDEREIGESIGQLLIDGDENVRIAAIEAFSYLSFNDIISKIGLLGGVSTPNSPLSNLADRARDKKHAVRVKSMRLLGQIWGVGASELASENTEVANLIDQIPSRILNAYYANDVDIHCLIDEVLFDSLIPLGYPSIKKKDTHSQKSSQRSSAVTELDADKVRIERLLLLQKDLDEKAKPVLLSIMGVRPMQQSKIMKAFLQRCEDFNGGVVENNDGPDVKSHLSRLIDHFSKELRDSAKASEDLWKFAKKHDRRCYALVKFCMSEESDYQKIFKSYKEFKRRVESAFPGANSPQNTLNALLYRVSNWFYNKSHIAPIMSFAQNEHHVLSSAAHELLRDISTKNPAAFKAHGQELCNFLQEHAPGSGGEGEVETLDALKACAAFARSSPDDVPKDRKFLQSILQYATRGAPPKTAKYAVSIILSSTDKKEMYVKEILRKCIEGFTFGSDHYLPRLASLSQLMLTASTYMDETKDFDPVMDIVIKKVLSRPCASTDHSAKPWDTEQCENCVAKTWALKVLANRLRSFEDAESAREIGKPIYDLLKKLIVSHGELLENGSTPQADKTRLRLQAALIHLKLCSHCDFDTLLTPDMFNELATVAQDSQFEVRDQFIRKIKKLLGQNRLPSRFYAVVFLLAFEPSKKLQRDSLTWLRARADAFAKAKKATMEGVLPRFLSLLAHHPDFTDNEDELKDNATYIVFFLQAAASPENIALLYHIAQRVKTVQDGIDAAKSERLYYLSDLAVSVITHYAAIQNWSIQAPAVKMRLPTGIFSALPNHAEAQRIAMKQYLPQDAFEELETVVMSTLKRKKRKLEDEPGSPTAKRRAMSTVSNGDQSKMTKAQTKRKQESKKPSNKKSSKKVQESPNEGASESIHRRRSGRAAVQKSYAEQFDSEDDAEMDEWDQ